MWAACILLFWWNLDCCGYNGGRGLSLAQKAVRPSQYAELYRVLSDACALALDIYRKDSIMAPAGARISMAEQGSKNGCCQCLCPWEESSSCSKMSKCSPSPMVYVVLIWCFVLVSGFNESVVKTFKCRFFFLYRSMLISKSRYLGDLSLLYRI